MEVRSEKVSDVEMDNSTNDDLRRLIEKLGDKLDNYIQTMPAIFLQRVEYETWRLLLEGRVKTLEEDNKSGKEWAHKEHTSLGDAVIASERRIMEKIDAATTRTWEQRVGQLVTTIGWIISIVLFVAGYVIQFLHGK